MKGTYRFTPTGKPDPDRVFVAMAMILAQREGLSVKEVTDEKTGAVIWKDGEFCKGRGEKAV